MDIQTILSQIDLGSYALPEFQRGYVWNRDQVRKLMDSLYKGYPIGGLLVWVTKTEGAQVRGNGSLQPGVVNLILDGQQRITSLYGIIKGKPPKFFDGNAQAFTGLYFNLQDESFEFYMAAKMKDDPNWINVTELMQKGIGTYYEDYAKAHGGKSLPTEAFGKLNRIDNIKMVDLHIQDVSGEEKTIDTVVEIFNNVNSGGTKLSKGDLALARLCGKWSDARNNIKQILDRLNTAGYKFEMEWLLRCTTIYLTGRVYYSELTGISMAEFRDGLAETEKLIDTILNQIGSRLGLDHDRVLGSRYSIPLMVGYLRKSQRKQLSSAEWNKLLYWYAHTMLWGRYAGSTESVLAQDLNAIESGQGVDGLIGLLRRNRGDLCIRPEDFDTWSTGSRFYPLLYMLSRVCHARDWGTGLELSNALLGRHSSLEVHHVFPKALLYERGYSKPMVNALANFTFLTKQTNQQISNREPADYIPEYRSKQPGAVESHWMPANSELLQINRYEDFLRQRQALLANSANEFLDSLINNRVGKIEIANFANRGSKTHNVLYMPVEHSDEEEALLETNIWMEERGLDQGKLYHELIDREGRQVAMIDLAWPVGIQAGLSTPVAIMLNESDAALKAVNQAGYTYFVTIEGFKDYVTANYLQ